VPFDYIFQNGSDLQKELGHFHHLQLHLNLLVVFQPLAKATFQWLQEWYCIHIANPMFIFPQIGLKNSWMQLFAQFTISHGNLGVSFSLQKQILASLNPRRTM